MRIPSGSSCERTTRKSESRVERSSGAKDATAKQYTEFVIEAHADMEAGGGVGSVTLTLENTQEEFGKVARFGGGSWPTRSCQLLCCKNNIRLRTRLHHGD